MGEKKNRDLSSRLPRNNMPLKDIFQKKIENSSSFLSDVWKPRYKEGNGGCQHQILEDNIMTDHNDIRKDGKHQSMTTKNCLQVQEVFENNGDDKEKRENNSSCRCGRRNCALNMIDRLTREDRLKEEDPPEKRMINDFEMMKSYKASEEKFPFSFLSLIMLGGDSDDKRQLQSSSDHEERKKDLRSSTTMKFLSEAFPNWFDRKSRPLDKNENENTKKQSKDLKFSPKQSRPPPKPPRMVFQLSISVDEDEKNENDASLKTPEKSVIESINHLNDDKSTDEDESVEIRDTGSINRVIPDENKLSISIDFSSHMSSEISEQKKPECSQSLPTHGNTKSDLDKDSNPGFSQSFTSDVQNEGATTKKSAEDFKTLRSSQRKFSSEKDSSPGSRTELNKSDSSEDDTFPYKIQQSNTFLSNEMDDFDDPPDDIFGPECGPEMEDLPGLYDPEDCHAPFENLSAASLPTDPQTLFEEHMHHCPAAVAKHHVCCNCNQFTKNQHMLYELVRTEGLEMHDVVPDGNCMFRAIIDQLRMQGIITMTCNGIRQMAVEYLRNNPLQNDGTHLEDFFVAADESWEEFLRRMSKDGEWGDQIVLRGLAEVIDREICIISTFGDSHNQTTITPQGASKVKKIYLGHVNDQHYYSLRPKGWHEKWYKETRKIQSEQKINNAAKDKDNQEIIEEESLQMEKLTSPCRPSKLINCSYQFTDEYSHVPVFHLNFIIENVLPESNIYTPYRYHGGRDYLVTSATTKVFEIAGSVEEGLSVNLYSISLQNDRSMGNESLNSIKATSFPNLYQQNGNFTLVFKENFMELNDEVIVIDTENSSPGYAVLKLGINHPKKYFKKVDGFYCLSNVYFQPDPKKINIPHSKNPHLPFQKACSYKWYYGKCPRWPKEATEWVSRERPSGWPDITLVKKTTKVPCVLTPIGHLLSRKPDMEWMFDFSFPEKFLLKDNVTKDKKYCFHVFKLLIDYHTGRRKELSTFVLKTIFLYMLEVIPSQQWEVCPSACVLYLIETLLLSLKEGKIPHYFIPANNIISHLDGSVLYKLIEKVNVVREFPIMSVILMAESHGLMTTYATDQIIDDLNHLSDHNNIHDSMLNTFIPAYSKIAVTSLSLMKFRQAVAAVTTGYRMLQELPCCSDGSGHPYGDLTLEGFIKEATGQSGLHFYQIWWLCFFVDLYKKENTLPSFIHRNPFKKISDMMRDCPPGDLDDVSVPNIVLQSYRYEYDYKSMHDIYFIIQLCAFLLNEGEYHLAAHYCRGLIRMMTAILNDTDSIMAEIIQGHQFRQGMDTKIDYLVQAYVTALSANLSNALYSLYKCYLYQGQPEYFQEYVDQFDSVCNSLATPSAFHLLADVWKVLGNKHKMKEALEKQDSMKAYS
ncbi:uncharacterized protein [Mytilus edulis]|uniref:uncharacterized protein n=1 Tax=Mytilus edulis TaxID=6550 RepID=UPI0039F045AD